MPPPTDTEVARLLTAIRARTLRLLARRGFSPDADVGPADAVGEESPALANFSAASVQGRVALGSRAGARVMAFGRDPEAQTGVDLVLGTVAELRVSVHRDAEATRTQQVADWIASHQRAFAFFGGVPAAVVPDQLKSGVTIACRYEPGIQRTYEEFAQHYGTAILPARPSGPAPAHRLSRHHAVAAALGGSSGSAPPACLTSVPRCV